MRSWRRWRRRRGGGGGRRCVREVRGRGPHAGRAGLRLRSGCSGPGSPAWGSGRLSAPRHPAARSPWR
eukprot:5304736-Alexandrium_andersonii.AAC.1